MPDANQWFPLVAVAFGFAGALVTEVLRDWRATRREDRRRAVERDRIREDARDAFQRETLLELQEMVQRHLRANGAIHHHDVIESRRSGTWGRSRIPAELNDEDFETGTRLILLSSRVLDDETRTAVEQFKKLAASTVTHQSELESEGALSEMGELVAAQIHPRIGELLRTTYR